MRGFEVLAGGVNLGDKDSILSHLDHELMLSLFCIYFVFIISALYFKFTCECGFHVS